ncbi:MAG: NepR family anti-sigma factor [Rhizomicrobium sp.]
MSFAPRGRGWIPVKDDQGNDRDRNRTIRARQRALGRELRRMYDNVAREPVPDDLLDILNKIDDGKGDKP